MVKWLINGECYGDRAPCANLHMHLAMYIVQDYISQHMAQLNEHLRIRKRELIAAKAHSRSVILDGFASIYGEDKVKHYMQRVRCQMSENR